MIDTSVCETLTRVAALRRDKLGNSEMTFSKLIFGLYSLSTDIIALLRQECYGTGFLEDRNDVADDNRAWSFLVLVFRSVGTLN